MKRRFKRYTQHKGEMLWISHDFSPYANEHSTSISTVVTQEASSGLTIEGETTTGNLWSARIGSTTTTGRLTFELKGTFADSSIQVLEFEIVVFDD